MRGEVLLFLPMGGNRQRITDEFRQTTYGIVEQRSLGAPKLPHQKERFRFTVRIELTGSLSCAEEFDDMAEAQAFAESFLRAHGQLG